MLVDISYNKNKKYKQKWKLNKGEEKQFLIYKMFKAFDKITAKGINKFKLTKNQSKAVRRSHSNKTSHRLQTQGLD